MKKYMVSLILNYIVIVSVKSKKDAKEYTEFYIGGGKDLVTEQR